MHINFYILQKLKTFYFLPLTAGLSLMQVRLFEFDISGMSE